jgi:hypothetical protein
MLSRSSRAAWKTIEVLPNLRSMIDDAVKEIRKLPCSCVEKKGYYSWPCGENKRLTTVYQITSASKNYSSQIKM